MVAGEAAAPGSGRGAGPSDATAPRGGAPSAGARPAGRLGKPAVRPALTPDGFRAGVGVWPPVAAPSRAEWAEAELPQAGTSRAVMSQAAPVLGRRRAPRSSRRPRRPGLWRAAAGAEGRGGGA